MQNWQADGDRASLAEQPSQSVTRIDQALPNVSRATARRPALRPEQAHGFRGRGGDLSVVRQRSRRSARRMGTGAANWPRGPRVLRLSAGSCCSSRSQGGAAVVGASQKTGRQLFRVGAAEVDRHSPGSPPRRSPGALALTVHGVGQHASGISSRRRRRLTCAE